MILQDKVEANILLYNLDIFVVRLNVHIKAELQGQIINDNICNLIIESQKHLWSDRRNTF